MTKSQQKVEASKSAEALVRQLKSENAKCGVKGFTEADYQKVRKELERKLVRS